VGRERLPRVLSALRTVAEATGASVARVALAWQLTKPFVTSVIFGAKKREQLVDNLAAADLHLSPEHVKEGDPWVSLTDRLCRTRAAARGLRWRCWGSAAGRR